MKNELEIDKMTEGKFDFGDLFDKIIEKTKKENTWTLSIPTTLTQEEVNSLVYGAEAHLQSALPMGQIIMQTPVKYVKELTELSKINKTIHLGE